MLFYTKKSTSIWSSWRSSTATEHQRYHYCINSTLSFSWAKLLSLVHVLGKVVLTIILLALLWQTTLYFGRRFLTLESSEKLPSSRREPNLRLSNCWFRCLPMSYWRLYGEQGQNPRASDYLTCISLHAAALASFWCRASLWYSPHNYTSKRCKFSHGTNSTMWKHYWRVKRFHLNGHTIGFHPQTQKLQQHTKKWYHVKVLLKRFHLNGHTIGFHPQTQKLELQTK